MKSWLKVCFAQSIIVANFMRILILILDCRSECYRDFYLWYMNNWGGLQLISNLRNTFFKCFCPDSCLVNIAIRTHASISEIRHRVRTLVGFVFCRWMLNANRLEDVSMHLRCPQLQAKQRQHCLLLAEEGHCAQVQSECLLPIRWRRLSIRSESAGKLHLQSKARNGWIPQLLLQSPFSTCDHNKPHLDEALCCGHSKVESCRLGSQAQHWACRSFPFLWRSCTSSSSCSTKIHMKTHLRRSTYRTHQSLLQRARGHGATPATTRWRMNSNANWLLHPE